MNLEQALEQIVNQRRSIRIFDATAPFDQEAVTRSLNKAQLAPNSSNMQLWEFYRIQSPSLRQKAADICLGQIAARSARELVVFVCRRDKWRERRDFNLRELKQHFAGAGQATPLAAQRKALNYYARLMPFVYTSDRFGILGGCKKIAAWFLSLVKPGYRELGEADLRVVAHKSCALAAQTFMLAITAEGYASCPLEGFDSCRMRKLLNLPRGAEISLVVAVGPPKPEGLYGPRSRVQAQQVVFRL